MLMRLATFWHVNRDQSGLRRRTVRLALPVLAATALLVVAAVVPRQLSDVVDPFVVQAVLWVLAVAVEYTAGVVSPGEAGESSPRRTGPSGTNR
ncbi:hypothetical protein [Plantactinospora sp. KLBMP9567]|uniref:hypothetical protein n=1 Tax=Plantactinospora sp. KLBMP9567 TaxID=3085900 RepID=UPI0029814EBD|nr:hypothetical protein [Plantactinospora sp. KLBMP9567]MDW5326722.1 hypothetical protein [Plantactinospora sp. KLBMP9567]